MAETNVPSGSPIAVKHYSAALFANTLKGTSALENLVGPVEPSATMEKFAGQTQPGMPLVRIDNLMKGAGEVVSLDLVDTVGGEPLMGDINREGKGSTLSFSSMEIKIDLASKVIDAGGSMSQQRTKHNLREIALAQLSGYFPRLDTQESLVHLAGARGSQIGTDWTIPLQSAPNFTSVMVNPVKAPTFNRHFVVNGANLVQGGQQLGAVVSTDQLKLSHLDNLRKRIDDMDQPLQSVKLAGDSAAQTSRMWVFVATPNQYSILLTEGSLRAFQQNAVNRAAYLDGRHPLFAGEVGMWNGILVIKNRRERTHRRRNRSGNQSGSGCGLCGGAGSPPGGTGAWRSLRQNQDQRNAVWLEGALVQLREQPGSHGGKSMRQGQGPAFHR